MRMSDQAYATIRRQIIECALRPGSTTSEPELSSRTGCSKASVRSALLRLAQEDLVQPVPRQGYRISPLTIRDARNILDLRLILEPHAARLAAGRLDRKSFEPIRRYFVKGYDPQSQKSISEFLRYNRDFRLLAPRAAGNDRLVGMISEVLDELERYLRITLAQFHHEMGTAFVERFDRLVEALVSGAPAVAEELTREQLNIARDQVLRALITRAEIMDAPLG